jgi:hypothetical protein
MSDWPYVFGAPAPVLSTANADGSALTVMRTDVQLALFDATVPVTQAFGDAAAAGSAAVAARRDHRHGMPAASSLPGEEIAYVEFTSNVSITGTGAVDIVSSGAITYTATPIIIEFWCRAATAGPSANLRLLFMDGATELARMAAWATNFTEQDVYAKRRLTPSAASHTYKFAGQNVGSQTSTIVAGAGGAGVDIPGFIRITYA